MAQLVRTTPSPLFYRISASLPAVTRRIGLAATIWSARRRSRIALSRLPDHLLGDIGLDRMSCAAESQRPFWR